MKIGFLFIRLFLSSISLSSMAAIPYLTSAQLNRIGNKIWNNEASLSTEKLTWWLDGEEWASLGIGHFIWYPQGVGIQRTQTFPDLLAFLKQQGVTLPTWLEQTASYCPWKTKEDFFKQFNEKKMIQLRQLLVKTIELQTEFIINRFSSTLQHLLACTNKNKQKKLILKYNCLADSPEGLYAMIDYVNFKGEGINKNERYQNRGWGLLQVLENMRGNNSSSAIKDFVLSAHETLKSRVYNAPQKNEERFLLGWKNRVNTYLGPL